MAVGVLNAGSHPGVREAGFQAGVEDIKDSGIGVAPPEANGDEVDGCESHNGGTVTCRDL